MVHILRFGSQGCAVLDSRGVSGREGEVSGREGEVSGREGKVLSIFMNIYEVGKTFYPYSRLINFL